MSLLERSILYKHLAALIKAGLPLTRALKILSSQSAKKLRTKIDNISLDLEKGISFTQSMKQNGLLSDDAVCCFRIAEENASLVNVLEKTSRMLEDKDRNQKDLRRALTYPAVVFFSSILSLVFLLGFVLPSYMSYFSELDCKLPLITRIAMKLPDYSVFIFVFLSLLVFCIAKLFSDFEARTRIPVFGPLFRASFLREFCGVLHYQLKNGVPFVSALNNINEGIPSVGLRKKISEISNMIENGEPIAAAFSQCSLFDGTFSQIAGIGEETGSLSDMIFEAGEHYGSVCDMQLKKYSALIEPAATLFVGGVVCFMAAAMLLPLFSMVNALL